MVLIWPAEEGHTYQIYRSDSQNGDYELIDGGGTRDGQSAPYCQWNELIEMSESGEINIGSHTYGLHHYNTEGRVAHL